MARSDKAVAVADLTDQFRSSQGAVLTDYRGLTVQQLQDLRRALGENADYAVVKNTLTKLAAKDAGVEGFDDLLVGPTAIAFITGDAVGVAKSLRDFARANPPLVIKGGVLDGKPLTVDEIAKIADLESREVLLGKLAEALLASLSSAVHLLNAPLSQAARLVGAWQAKAEQDASILGGGAEGPALPRDDTSDDTSQGSPAVREAPESPVVDGTTNDVSDAMAAAEATPDVPAADSADSQTVTRETAKG